MSKRSKVFTAIVLFTNIALTMSMVFSKYVNVRQLASMASNQTLDRATWLMVPPDSLSIDRHSLTISKRARGGNVYLILRHEHEIPEVLVREVLR